MVSALHHAIRDALRSPAYAVRGILVTAVLEATTQLHVNEKLLYQAVFTIFRALPDRLVPGTTLGVSTGDLPDGGVEIFWEGKERIMDGASPGTPLREVLGHGPHGDLVEIALVALENYCNVNAGYVDTYRERVESSTSFDRPAHVIRRVLVVLPGAPNASTAANARRLAPTRAVLHASDRRASPPPDARRGGARREVHRRRRQPLVQ